MSKLVQTPPFPRTPYPFDQSGQHDFTGLDSISEWLRLNRHNEETEEDDYHPEALAFTADDWIACDGAEDGSWVVGAPDWLNESTEGITSSVREVIATPHNTESTSDSDTSSDMYSPSDVGSDKGGSSAFIGLATKQNVIPSAEGLPPRGIVRRQSDCSEVEFKMPERKRPRLDPLIINGSHAPIATPRMLTPLQVDLTPVSPFRQFHKIVAERNCSDGVMFKVVWRESWVHESKMPDVEPIRQAQYMQFGQAWEVIPGSPLVRSQ